MQKQSIIRIADPRAVLTTLLAGAFTLSLTLWAWHVTGNAESQRTQARFQNQVQRVKLAIESRMNAYEQMLRSGVGLIEASDHVNRQEWKLFVETMEIETYYPGLLGTGYAERVVAADREAHVRRVRREGFPDYRLWPEDGRDDVSAIVYLEPFNDRNKRAFGFDMTSEPVRRAAMERARNTGLPAMSGKVTLVQETDVDVQAGFLVYLPVFQKGKPVRTVEERNEALLGWVYSPFRMNDFIRSSLDLVDPEQLEISVTIHDGTSGSDDMLMFTSDPAHPSPILSDRLKFHHSGHVWTLSFATLPRFELGVDKNLSRAILILGLAISLLIAFQVGRMATARNRALATAKSMKAALGKSERLFRKVFESAGHGVALVGLDGQWMDFNLALCEITGYGEKELRETNLRSITHIDDQEVDKDQRQRLLTGEIEFYQVEKRFVRNDDREAPVILSFGMLHDDDDIPLYFVLQIVDISEWKASEAKFIQAQKMEAVGQLTGGIAHDFNNILGIVLGNLQLLERRTVGDQRLANLIGQAIAATRRGAELTGQLLAFSRTQQLEPQVLEINSLVSGMDNMLQRTLGDAIEIETKFSDVPGRVKADPSQLESAILNLAINARDAMPDGGHLFIETFVIELDEHYAENNSGVVAGHHACISVCDTGPGIPDDVRSQIFQPFFTTKSVGKGTGLGLSMVFGFVKQTGGHIDVYSEPEQGTCFRIFLPLTAEADVEALAEESKAGELPRGSETVLMVEDNEQFRQTASLQLEDLGYAVIAETDGPNALKSLEMYQDVDILFSDMIMPGGMNGHEVALAAQKLKPNLPVLLTSGYPRDSFSKGRKFPLLVKPYTNDALARMIRQTLDQPAEQEG